MIVLARPGCQSADQGKRNEPNGVPGLRLIFACRQQTWGLPSPHQAKQTHAKHRGRPRFEDGLDAPAAEAGAAKIGAYTVEGAPVSIVTAPVSAKPLSHRIQARVRIVMLWSARMLPAKVVLVPRVAELPTSQKTPPLAPPLITLIVAPLAVVRVLPI